MIVRILLLSIAWSVSFSSLADNIAIIGTGNVGSALGKNWHDLGHTIFYGSRNPNSETAQRLVADTGERASVSESGQAVANADIVVLAVPWDVVEETVGGLGDLLSGKIIIDPTNPRQQANDGLTDMALATSNAQRIKDWVPGADVVKSFNLMDSFLMERPHLLGFTFSMPIAGDDRAKAWLKGIAGEMGFAVVDFGKVRHAHILEALYTASVNSRSLGFQGSMQFREIDYEAIFRRMREEQAE